MAKSPCDEAIQASGVACWIASLRCDDVARTVEIPPRHGEELLRDASRPSFRPDRRILEAVVVVGLPQHAVHRRLGHELGHEGQGLRMIQRHRHRGGGLLEGFV